MKVFLLYGLTLTLTWIALLSIMYGLGNWHRHGALMPIAIGLASLFTFIFRLLFATIRVYLPPPNKS